MFKINKSKICLLIMSAFVFSMIIAFSATDSFAQRNGERNVRKVTLKKDSRKNGYKIVKESEKYYFLANNVIDPVTKKLVEGDQTLSYKCKDPIMPTTRTPITLSRGNSQRIKVACALMSEPTILILDEPNPS